MCRLAALLVTVLATLSLSPAQADSAAPAGLINGDIVEAANQLSVGIGALRQEYHEFNDGLVAVLPAVLDAETGDLVSVGLGYSILLPYFYGQARLNVAAGDTTYVGYLQTFEPGGVTYTPFTGTTTNTIVSFTGRLGYPFRAGDHAALVPYLEVGEHYWRRDIGYVEDYNHLYVGLGAKLLFSPASQWVFELGGGYGTTVLASLYAEGYDFNLGEKPYVNVYASVDYRLNAHWYLQLSADYRSWEYGQSPVVAGFVEPHSETQQTQVLVSLSYAL
jgi:hypothetical protein